MAGILDKKTRFIDLIVTQEGKRQIASGKLRAEYASLSDASVFYDPGQVDDDVRKRIYFQPMHKHTDVLVLEKDDSGKLIDFDFSPTGSIVGEDIFSKEEDPPVTDLHKLKITTGSQFASLSKLISKAFLGNFKANQFIGTSTRGADEEKFEISTNELRFAISNSVPFERGPKKEVINVNSAEPFLLDSKLTHIENFNYLPPENIDGSPYGVYKDLRNMTKETWPDIKSQLGHQYFEDIDDFMDETDDLRIDNSGDYKVLNRKELLPTSTNLTKEYKIVRFNRTSEANNLIIQMFEFDKFRSKFKKLDIVDAGVFYDDEDVNGKFEKRVFYVGKIYLDSFNTPTFISIFTIVMD